jgi:uncharacterized protein YbbK (DUF523 family)
LLAEELENYKHRLMGLILPERIKTVTIPRPRMEIIKATQKEEEIVRLLEQGASMGQLTAILPPSKW